MNLLAVLSFYKAEAIHRPLQKNSILSTRQGISVEFENNAKEFHAGKKKSRSVERDQIANGTEGGSRTHMTKGRQILSLVRLPIPPLRLVEF